MSTGQNWFDGAKRPNGDAEIAPLTGASPEFTITLFADQGAHDRTFWTGTLENLAQDIQAVIEEDKARLPWLKLAGFGEQLSGRGCYRHNANVTRLSGVEGDYDGGQVSFAQAVDLLGASGVGGLIYTTPSNTLSKPRWRVLCPTSRFLPPTERDALMDRLNGIFRGALAQESWTLSQAYYFGNVIGKPPVHVEIIDGDFIDLRSDLPSIGKPGGDRPTREPREAQAQADSPVISPDQLERMTAAVVDRARFLHGGESSQLEDERPDLDYTYPNLIKLVMSIARVNVEGDDDEARRLEAATKVRDSVYDSHMDDAKLRNAFEAPDDGSGVTHATFFKYARLGRWKPTREDKYGDPGQFAEAAQTEAVVEVDHEETSVNTAAGSEDQIALRFAKLEGDRLRSVDDWKSWMLFDGAVWRRAPSPAIWNLARPYVRQAALQVESTTQQRAMLARTKVAGVEALARGDLLKPGDAWDTDPWQLNTPGGTVDLRTGTMHPAMAAAFCTKMTAAAPGGDCPRWLQFLAEVTDSNRELHAYLQRLAGLTLIGKVIDHVLPFFYGTGSNGKGVYLETLGAILGDYAQVAPMSLFTEKRNEQHPTGIARLQGARFVRAQETEQGRAWDETLIKTLTGGDRLTGRFMHGNFFEFDPQHTLIIAGNHKPPLRNVDEAIRRRIHMVPFTVTIPVEKRDEQLREKLTLEAGGILRWAIEGCLDYQRGGLQPPAAVRDTTLEYLDSQDPLSEWLADCCIKGGDAFTAKPVLHASYVSHCRKAGTTAFIPEEFYAKLENHGFAAGKRVGVRGFRGITLKD